MSRLLNVGVLASGLVVAACSTTVATYDEAPMPARTQYVVAAPAPVVMNYNCIDYGFVAGTAAYDRCAVREAHIRTIGRVSVDYSMARLDADARESCYSYGLSPGSSAFNRCVAREVDARRYRHEVFAPAPPATQYVYTPGYDSRVATTGVAVYTDEYGFRYDAQGNRVDRFGNVISPHSTQRY